MRGGLGELKSHIRDIESELLDMSVNAHEALGSGGSRRKITKDAFLKAQKTTNSGTTASQESSAVGGDFIQNLIKRPHRRTSSRDGSVCPVSRPSSRQALLPKEPVESSSVSNDSEPIAPRLRSGTNIDSVLQLELYESKRKLEQEHERRTAILQKNLEELRHKRICDKETFKDELARYERDLNELKAVNKALEDTNTLTTHDLKMAETHMRDYKMEIEKLQRDLDRHDQRALKANQAVTELEGKLRAEKQAFDARVLQLEAQISDLRESELKLRARDEKMQAKMQALVDEVNAAAQSLAAEKTLHEKTTDELARYHKKMESEIEDYERLKATCEIKMHELNTELQAETQRLRNAQNELREVQQREANLQARFYDKEKDSRKLLELQDLHQTVSSERLMLQTQLRAMTDECERLKSRCMSATQAEQAAIVRSEEAETENHKLKKKIEALQVQCSKSIVFNAATRVGGQFDGLTDTDGMPICKLRSATTAAPLPAARPVWWFEGGDTSASVVRRSNSGFPQSTSVPIGVGVTETVMPVPHPVGPTTEAPGVQVLRQERRNAMREMAKMPTNPNYRTTDENERWAELKQQIQQIEHDIRLLESGC